MYRAQTARTLLALRLQDFIHSGISRRADTRMFSARLAGAEIGRQWVSSEHRKNGKGFPVLRTSHQRFVGFMQARWQQWAAAGTKKAGAGPAFFILNVWI